MSIERWPIPLFLTALLALRGEVAQAQSRDVPIAGSDGFSIQATYYDPGKRGPGIVLFRNCDETRASVDAFARKLMDRGFHVVSYDYRPSLIAGYGWLQTRASDMASVRTWFFSRANVDTMEVAAIEGSCGVQLALGFATSTAPNVKGAVILSGPHEPGQRDYVASTPSFAVLAAASEEEHSEQYMRPIAEASRNYRSRLVVLKGSAHGTNMLREPGFEATALSWLEDLLLTKR